MSGRDVRRRRGGGGKGDSGEEKAGDRDKQAKKQTERLCNMKERQTERQRERESVDLQNKVKTKYFF